MFIFVLMAVLLFIIIVLFFTFLVAMIVTVFCSVSRGEDAPFPCGKPQKRRYCYPYQKI
jgi:hypothetical protein